jgi:trigger factor
VKTTVQDISEIKKQLDVVLPPEELARELDEAYERIGKKAHLKGFRQGKAPRSVLEQSYSQEAESEAVRHLVEKSYPNAIQEAKLLPIASPEITITQFDPAKGFSYQAVVELRPVFEVKGYAGFSLEKEGTEVTDAEVGASLKELQERMVQLIPVLEERAVRSEDVVVMDFQAFRGTVPLPRYKANDFVTELGKKSLFPEMEAGVVGMKRGEKRKIDVTFPTDWSDKELAGAKIAFEILLKEVKAKKLPELTDDFAKDLGAFTTLEEVKIKIREDLAKTKEQSVKNGLRRQVIEKLIEKNEFPIPEGMIHAELEDMLRRLEGSLKNQGITLEQAGITPEDFFVKNRDGAIFQVKAALLFDAIANKESITVTPEEVDEKIDAMARLSGQSGEVWKKYYKENNLLGQVAWAVREEKTLDFVLSQSKIKTK